jgi:hypothetical protein
LAIAAFTALKQTVMKAIPKVVIAAIRKTHQLKDVL